MTYNLALASFTLAAPSPQAALLSLLDALALVGAIGNGYVEITAAHDESAAPLIAGEVSALVPRLVRVA